ncbi:hypothetical protein [Alishewanella sp. SMS8]|uniref:hypothetical protein n=1 Tax=Alishewanella sp. SMS8 TaxID=2994676 RepID=UPI002741628B|nr:hypothetical protein [Alishewanella sp. SMS8]MDP5460456.1 hypothetical protein [Alishewanella sp. SMS8]
MNNSVTLSKSTGPIRCLGFLLDNEQGRLKYIFKAGLLVLVIGLPLAITLTALFPNVNQLADSFDFSDRKFIFKLLAAPIVETMMMGLIFLLIRIFTKRLLVTCAVSAGIWAVLHGVSFPIQGVVNFFSFFIYSLGYLVWLKKSFHEAFLITISIHMFNNAFVLIFIVLAMRFVT